MSAFAAICALLLGAAVLLWLPRQLPAHLGVLGSAAAAEPVPAGATGIESLLRRLRRRDAAAEAGDQQGREDEERDMAEQAFSEEGTIDHRDATEVAMELLSKELGAKPM